MILTSENYHSPEAKKEFFSVSRYKAYAGCLGIVPCEARAVAEECGEWITEPSTAMKASSFVDAHFSGVLDVFKAQNPDMFTKQGELKADFRKATEIIQRIERSEYFMKYMSGEKQVIMTAELFGAKWSIMVDSYLPNVAIVDLKVMADLRDSFYVKDWGRRVSFVENYGYDIQAAIYQAVVEANTGKKLPVYLACASKESEPDIEIIGFPQGDLDDVLSLVGPNIPRILSIKSGRENPERCGCCDYCRKTKVITGPINYRELINE